MLGHEAIRLIISALGTGIRDTFDITKLRYHKVIIMTDADVDGAHIRTLLLTFFFRNMVELIENGNLYIAQPPLYRLQQGKTTHYFFSDPELKAFQRGKKQKGNVQRFKGLGEMNADQLWETALKPDSRILMQVTIEDAAKPPTDIFSELMGEDVSHRKPLHPDPREGRPEPGCLASRSVASRTTPSAETFVPAETLDFLFEYTREAPTAVNSSVSMNALDTKAFALFSASALWSSGLRGWESGEQQGCAPWCWHPACLWQSLAFAVVGGAVRDSWTCVRLRFRLSIVGSRRRSLAKTTGTSDVG